MPVERKADVKGSYYRYGETGAKYYYIPGNKQSREIAKQKAMKQGRAIEFRRRSAF